MLRADAKLWGFRGENLRSEGLIPRAVLQWPVLNWLSCIWRAQEVWSVLRGRATLAAGVDKLRCYLCHLGLNTSPFFDSWEITHRNASRAVLTPAGCCHLEPFSPHSSYHVTLVVAVRLTLTSTSYANKFELQRLTDICVSEICFHTCDQAPWWSALWPLCTLPISAIGSLRGEEAVCRL